MSMLISSQPGVRTTERRDTLSALLVVAGRVIISHQGLETGKAI